MSDQKTSFENRRFLDFLTFEMKMDRDSREQWRMEMLIGSDITENQLHEDIYRVGKRGIPPVRLQAYCDALGVPVQRYFDYCTETETILK
jgi:hypothetical protein